MVCAGSLELFVMQGKDKHNIVCRPDASVECLKQQIEMAAGVMPEAQKLIWRGKQLKDADSIAAAGLKNGDKLLLTISRVSGSKGKAGGV